MEVPRGGGTHLFGLYGYVPTGQGMVFWPRCPKQGIQFDLPLS